MANSGSEEEAIGEEANANHGSANTTQHLFRFPGERGRGQGDGDKKNRKPRKKQFRWNYQKDLALVTEVERIEPFNSVGIVASGKWGEVAEGVMSSFDGTVTSTGAKERFMRLISDHKKEDCQNRYKSGTEEELTALSIRLADLSSKLEDKKLEEKQASDAKAKRIDEEKAAGEEIRNAATTTKLKRPFNAENKEDAPPAKRSTEKNLIDLWKEKQEHDRLLENRKIEKEADQRSQDRDLRREEMSIAKEKLALEAKKLQLEEEKIKMEKAKLDQESQMAKERFELEKLERLSQIKTQETLIQLLNKK